LSEQDGPQPSKPNASSSSAVSPLLRRPLARDPATVDRRESRTDGRAWASVLDSRLPFEWSPRTLERGLNFTLTTARGDIDLFGEVSGGGTHQELVPHTVEVELFARSHRCLDLPAHAATPAHRSSTPVLAPRWMRWIPILLRL
jgi:hypothetical protein